MSAAASVHHELLLSAWSAGLPITSAVCGRAAVRSTTAASVSRPGGEASGGSALSST